MSAAGPRQPDDVDSCITLEECEEGTVYRLASRNLAFGAYDGVRGFIGIRSEFDFQFLSVEYHWDHPPCATAKPLEGVAAVPSRYVLAPDLGTMDQVTGVAVYFDPRLERWVNARTREVFNSAQPVVVPNVPLHAFLEKVESGHA